MASIRKSFNFRSGVQVDDDNFIVNTNGLVGIGTSSPSEVLDVIGNIKVSGFTTASTLYATNASINGLISSQNLNVSGIATINRLNSGNVSIDSGIVTATSGVVTYYGDGGKLLNLPTSQWLDIDVGLGFTSIYNRGFVGIATNDPRFTLQIGGNPTLSQNGIGFNSTGNIRATGIITASSFSGSGVNLTNLNASNISSGTLNNSRLPNDINVSGIITASTSFVGNLVGFASTSYNVDSGARLSIVSIDSTFSNSSISTVTNTLNVNGRIGVGTVSPRGDIEIRKTSGISTVQIISESGESRLIVGRVVGTGNSYGSIQFGNTNGTYSSSTSKSLDIINYDTGNVNTYLNILQTGINTGSFNWIYGTNTSLMKLTYDGKLGINQSNPQYALHVGGSSSITNDLSVGGNLILFNSLSVPNITVSNTAIFNNKLLVKTNSGSYDLQVGTNPTTNNGGVGINTNGTVRISNSLTTADIVATNVSAGTSVTTATLYANQIGQQSSSVGSFDVVNANSLTVTSFSPSDLTVSNNLSVSNDSFFYGRIGIKSDNPKSDLDMSSSISAFYPPVIDTTQRTGLTTYAGAIIFNTDTGTFQGYTGIGWTDFH